jgi:glycosyltransferase involved in cell wall biosynthesis
MRIALVATQRTSVPPERSGSVELVVDLMARDLIRRGHEVTVFGTQDSRVPGRVLSVLATGYYHDQTVWDWRLAEFMQLGLVYEHADEFDVINSHVYCYALPFTRLVRTPTVHTFHICPTPDFVRFCRRYREGSYVLLSEFQRQFFGGLPVAGIVPNGIDTASFSFSPEPGRYLAYMGEFGPEKGTLEAIHCARASGIPLRLAGRENPYFHGVVKPELGRGVEYVGELGHEDKVALLGSALALLFPGRAPEACPLVVLEAMACGTPVLGFAGGPVPGLAPPGVGGMYGDDLDALASAAQQIATLDRAAIRCLAVERFDVSRMVDAYLEVFDRALEGAPASDPPAPVRREP